MITTAVLDNDEHLALTKWYIEKDQLDNALREIKPLLNEKAEQEVLLTAGALYAQLRLFPKAQTFFARYLDTQPNALSVRFQLGMTQYESEQVESALETWSAILNSDPLYPPALFYSALGQLRQNQPQQAHSLLQTIVQKVSTDNLYYQKAQELSGQLARDPDYRNATQADFTQTPIYTTEH